MYSAAFIFEPSQYDDRFHGDGGFEHVTPNSRLQKQD